MSSTLDLSQTLNGSKTNLLRPKSLNNILAKANTNGVKCTLILNHEGSLLARAGGDSSEAVTIAALASTIWKNYQRYGNSALHEDKLKSAVIQSQEAKLVVRDLSSVLICVYADGDIPTGMLKKKANSIADFLKEPLELILKP